VVGTLSHLFPAECTLASTAAGVAATPTTSTTGAAITPTTNAATTYGTTTASSPADSSPANTATNVGIGTTTAPVTTQAQKSSGPFNAKQVPDLLGGIKLSGGTIGGIVGGLIGGFLVFGILGYVYLRQLKGRTEVRDSPSFLEAKATNGPFGPTRVGQTSNEGLIFGAPSGFQDGDGGYPSGRLHPVS
jgi:hypothetical protein